MEEMFVLQVTGRILMGRASNRNQLLAMEFAGNTPPGERLLLKMKM
jgi:hypothetical protein